MIVISEPQKGSDVLDASGSLPLPQCIQFILYKSDPLNKELELLHVVQIL